MRIIAGTYRSRRLVSPPGDAVRPTSDRLRETLFNMLGPERLAGSRFADLYAGTGAVGLEAISRGALHTWFGENAPAALQSLRANLAALRVPPPAFTVEERGAGALLGRFTKLNLAMDLIFLDPPYEAEAEYVSTLGTLGSPAGRRLLAPGGMVVVEHATRTKFTLGERFGGLIRTRTYKQGDSSLAFYQVEAQDNSTPASAA